MINIADNLKFIESKISQCTKKCARKAEDVQLLAVSKTKSAEQVKLAYQAGQRAFGESYAQEASDKVAQLAHLENIEWHFIGPIQSNKTKLIADSFSWVHSIDRSKIAQRLNDQRADDLPPLNVLIQVNISAEQNKSGISPNQVEELAKFISNCPKLHLRGLMAIPEKTVDKVNERPHFIKMYELYDALKKTYPQIDTLSMGMSGDMEAAIAAGSTMVRIGTAIFGARD